MIAIDGWKNQKLSDLADYINGYAFKPDDWGKDGLPIIRIEQLKNADAPTDYYSGKLPAKNIVENGDLVFSWSASLFLRIWQNGRAALNQHLFKVEEKEGIDKLFLKLFIEYYLPELTKASHGSTMQHITRKELDRFNAPFPISKTEQIKIAEILSTVDRAIEQTEALIAKQQRIKTGLMQDLLTRGIDEHGNLRSEQTHKFKDSPLGRIPVEWEIEKWSQVCSKIQDGTHFSPRTDASAEFKYLTSKNIKFGFLDMSDVEYIDRRQHDEIFKRCNVCFGDVLLTKDGANTGNAAINFLHEEFSLLSSVALIRPLEGKLTSMFLLQTILSESGQRLIKDAMSGLAITRVTLEVINNFLMKVPPIKEQKSIGHFLAVQDEQIKATAKILDKHRVLKTALMQDLLTGNKRVSVLLDFIMPKN